MWSLTLTVIVAPGRFKAKSSTKIPRLGFCNSYASSRRTGKAERPEKLRLAAPQLWISAEAYELRYSNFKHDI